MLKEAIIPDLKSSAKMAQAVGADNFLCATCGTCDQECPVVLSTGRLKPQKIIRMTTFGLLDELLQMPDIWYCINCRRCMHGCPNRVKPFQVNSYLRNQAISQGIVSEKIVAPYQKLLLEFQRVRWRAVACCLKGQMQSLSEHQWYQWLKTPLQRPFYDEIEIPAGGSGDRNRRVDQTNSRSCFTCSECSSCCPIFGDRTVFDPQKIVRMVNLGLTEDLLRSPSIWLCLGCRRCTDSCSQLVGGHEIIRKLQRQAIEKGYVDPFFHNRLAEADRLIYPRLFDQIDTLLGLYRNK